MTMMLMSQASNSDQQLYSLATELLRQCLVPELKQNIGDVNLESNDFVKFKNYFDEKFNQFINLIQTNPQNIMNTNSEELAQINQEFFANIILVFCEQTAKHSVYRTDNNILMNNLQFYLGQMMVICFKYKSITTATLNWYKMRIRPDCWRRNIGAVHGFPIFCQMKLVYDKIFTLDESLFMLSAGTLLLEHFDHVYKELGLDIFMVLMDESNKKNILVTNIHDAVYDLCFRYIPTIKDEQILQQLWQILITCLTLKYSANKLAFQPSKWTNLDDTLQALLNRLAFESTIEIRLILLKYLPIFILISQKQEFRFLDEINSDWSKINLVELKMNIIQENIKLVQPTIAFRWSKKILKIFIYHFSNGFISLDLFKKSLMIFHINYLTCIYPIPIKLIINQINEFFTEFTTFVLLGVQMLHIKYLPEVIDVIDTFMCHIRKGLPNLSAPTNENNNEKDKMQLRYEQFESIKLIMMNTA